MGNNLRCCLACVLPCGALDLIRIVHINGEIEEYGRPVSAKEVLDANPNHVISKPCSQGVSHRIMIVSPESELKRGSIYFLIPASAFSQKEGRKDHTRESQRSGSTSTTSIKTMDQDVHNKVEVYVGEKKRGHRRRKSNRIEHWRPNLESIYEYED